VVVAVAGTKPNLEKHFRFLMRQAYPDYRVLFVRQDERRLSEPASRTGTAHGLVLRPYGHLDYAFWCHYRLWFFNSIVGK